MLCCAVLCCAVLCCAVLCCAVLCCAVLLWCVGERASKALRCALRSGSYACRLLTNKMSLIRVTATEPSDLEKQLLALEQ